MYIHVNNLLISIFNFETIISIEVIVLKIEKAKKKKSYDVYMEKINLSSEFVLNILILHVCV